MDQAGRNQGSMRNRFVFNILIIVAIVLVIVAVWFISSSLNSYEENDQIVLIHDGDGATTELPLDVNDVRTITTSKGTNVVVVEDGTVRVDQADCPNQDCVDQGEISEVGRQIICLPHELWVEIVNSDKGTEENGSDADPDEEKDRIDVIGS